MQFCLCQPDPKIPRPRNGKSIFSAPSDLGGKSFSIVSFDLERRSQICRTLVNMANVVKAFILYRQHYQAMVVAHNPGLANPEISKIIGEQWRSLSEDDKSKWKALAEVRQLPLCLMQR
jgi:HMG box factor